ncbi:MAG: Spy/CpxP family protein refolding chaperone [Phycisphaerae bacterium]
MKVWTKIGIGASVVVLALTGLTMAAGTTSTAGASGHRLAETPMRRLLGGILGRGQALQAELNLSAEQRTQLKDIMRSHKEQLVTTVNAVVEKRRALRDLVLAGKADDAALRAAATELGKVVGDAAVLASNIHGEMAKVLTPEQLEKIQKFRADKDQAVDGWLKELGKDW